MPTGLVPIAAPASVVEALERLVEGVRKTAGANLVSVVLYGGLARGQYRPGSSDVNLAIVLEDAGPRALDHLTSVLRVASREIGVEPMLLALSEIDAAADVFPTIFLDIRRHHLVLAGRDPFTPLEVSGEHVRLRVEQELREMLLKLRRRYVACALDGPAMLGSVLAVLRPLAVNLAFLLELEGHGWPEDDSTAGVFAAASTAFGLDTDSLARLSGLRADQAGPRDLSGLFDSLLEAVAGATGVADRLGGAR